MDIDRRTCTYIHPSTTDGGEEELELELELEQRYDQCRTDL